MRSRIPTQPLESRPRSRARLRRLEDRALENRDDRLRLSDPPLPYWVLTRRPVSSLLFLLPILVAYEFGVQWLGRIGASSARTGVDAWMHQVLGSLGLPQPWLPPAALLAVLVAWSVADRRPGRFRPACLPGMLLESVVLAVALVGLGRLVDQGLSSLEHARSLPLASGAGDLRDAHPLAPIIGYLGAGVYEEALFRLALIPLSYGLLRLFLMPRLLSGTLSVTASAILFSIAHHAGLPGEPFTWYAFFFRWAAGLFFAWVFVVRGFGIAVGTHAAYDILVGFIG